MLSRFEERAEAISRGLQVCVLGIMLAGVAMRNVSVVVNALMALGVTLLPAVIRREYHVNLGPGLTLWVTLAVFLHALGMLGPYGTVWWWDHMTHTLSATVVAGVGYAVVRAFDIHSEALYLPDRFMVVFVVLFTVGLGVVWEVLEFLGREVAIALGMEPVLVLYGLGDTMWDLVFDAIGGLLVALFGRRGLSGVVVSLVERFDRGQASE